MALLVGCLVYLLSGNIWAAIFVGLIVLAVNGD